jgi:hypothetical protein
MANSNAEMDDVFYRLIGQIVVTFNSVEALLRECIADSLGANTSLNLVVLSRVSFKELLEIFRITSHVAFDSRPDSNELQQRVGAAVKDLNTANDRRNIVVHGHYGEQIEINVDAHDDLYELRVLTRTRFKRDLDYVYFPSMATEQLYDLHVLEEDLERLKKAYSALDDLSRHLIKPSPSLGSVVE